MSSLKTAVAVMVLSLAVTSLVGCNKSNVETGSEAQDGRPMNQTFGKSFVKEIPPSEVRKKEDEMTAPTSEKKGPAVGEYTPAYEAKDKD